MPRTSHMVNRGDGVKINLNAPLRVRDKQMGIKKKQSPLKDVRLGLR